MRILLTSRRTDEDSADAIGESLGVRLARAGADVSLVARGSHLVAMRENGVRLLIGDEVHVARPRCYEANVRRAEMKASALA